MGFRSRLIRQQKQADKTVNISDKAAELATEHDIDISLIEGTGKEGRIIAKDIKKYIKTISQV